MVDLVLDAGDVGSLSGVDDVQLIAQAPTTANPLTASVAIGGSWDFGLSLSQLAREGSIAAITRLLKIPSSQIKRIEDFIKDKVGALSGLVGITDTDQILKVEFNVPFFNPLDGSDEALQKFKDDFTIHFKVSPAAWARLSQQQRTQILQAATGMPLALAENYARTIRPVGNTVKDMRISISPLAAEGGLNARFGSMFFAANDFINGGRNSKFLDLPTVGFVSPRIWTDGTLQLIVGAAGDVGVSRNDGTTSGLWGDPFFEVAGFASFKLKPGQLIKDLSGTYGFIFKVQGKEQFVALPDFVVDALPSSAKDQSTLLDIRGKYPLLAMSDVTPGILAGAVPDDKVQFAKDVYRYIKPVVDAASSPEVRDAVTLALGLAGFAGGPVSGTISLIGALQTISENQFEDFYSAFSALGYREPSQVYNALGGAISLVVAERAERIAELNAAIAENDRLGRSSNGEYSELFSLNEQSQFAIQKVIRNFDRALARSIETGRFGKSTVEVYRELTRLAASSSDPVMRSVAGALLGNTTSAQFDVPAANGGGTLTVGVNDSVFRKSFQLFKAIDVSAAREGGNPLQGFKFSDLARTQNPVILRDVTRYYLDNGGDPFTIALQASAYWQMDRASNGGTASQWANTVIDLVNYGDKRVSIASAILLGATAAYDFANRTDNLINVEPGMNAANLLDWANGGKFNFGKFINEQSSRDYRLVNEGKDNLVPVVWADGKRESVPSRFVARFDRIAYFMLREGVELNFQSPFLADRIANLKSAMNGEVYDTIRDPSVVRNLKTLKAEYESSKAKLSADDIAFLKKSLYNSNIFFRADGSEFDVLYASAGDSVPAVGIESTLPDGSPISAQLDATAISAVDAIIADETLSLKQKQEAITAVLAKGGLSEATQAALAAKLQEISDKVSRQDSLATLKADTANARRIAAEMNNPLGALLTNIVDGVLDTLLAQVDDTTKNKALAGSVNGVAAAAEALGLTFSEFVQLIGRGDLAAFGALIGDIGEIYKQANLGNAGTTTGAGFEMLGDALIAVGRQRGDNGLIIAGTAVSGVGSVIKASNDGVAGSATTAGLKLGGQLALTLGQLGGSKELQALGVALNAGGTIPALFGDGKPGNGSAATAEAASQVLGLLIGGNTGQFIGNLGSLVSTGFQIAGNTVPGGAGSLYVTAARQFLNLIGVKVDPAASFALGTLSTALAGGPVGWAVWGVGVLFNLFSMGTSSKTTLLADKIDADGDGFADDSASLRQEFRRGFFGSVRQTKHNILYDVNGVDIRLLQAANLTLTPEVNDSPIQFNGGSRGPAVASARINGTTVRGRLVDAQGREVSRDGYVRQGRSALRPTAVFFEVTPVVSPFGPQSQIAAGTRFAVRSEAEEGYSNWFLQQPTGNFVLNISATYGAINPSTAPVNAAQTWILSPADAEVWRGMMGGDSATIGAGDARAAAGTLLAGALDQMTARYQGNRNDPNLYMYIDMNGDTVPDMVRVGLQSGGLKAKGDGKVEVWLMDANRQQTGVSYLANDFAEAEQIGLRASQLLQWGAGRPDLWANGRDLGSLYIMARNGGLIALMDEANAITANSVTALLAGQPVDLAAAFARVDEINAALASPFNATEYMNAYPDVAAWAGGDPAKAAQHYINWGNNEGRAVNAAGLVLAKPVIRSTQEGGTLTTGQTLVSPSGNYFAIFQGDGNLVVYRGTPAQPREAIWSSRTDGKAAGGSVAIQGDGNLVVYDASGKARWASGTSGRKTNRPFTLAMQDDGNLVLYDARQGGEPVWGSINGRIALPEPNALPAATWSDAQALAYIASHQDLIAAFGANATAGRDHFNTYGTNEGRQITFDPAAYMAAHPDVAAWAGNDPAKAATHYINWGVFEGRVPAAGQPARTVPLDQRMAGLPWLALSYTASHPDLMNAFGTNSQAAINHYRTYGTNEGRQITFDPFAYMAANPDVAAWAGNDPAKAATHFIQHGRFENRAMQPGGAVRPAEARPSADQAAIAAGFVPLGSSIINGRIGTNQYLQSANGQFFAIFQSDGNLVVYRGTPLANGGPIWASNTQGKAAGGFAAMQADGNVVVYDASSKARWSSGSYSRDANRNFTLVMQDDGNLVAYDSQGGEALWSSMTGRIARPEPNGVQQAA